MNGEGWRRELEARWPLILALGVFALALWAQPNAMVGVFFDDGVYVALAKSLAEGHGYRNVHMPYAPPGVHFPFLYPVVLSLLWRLWPSFPANVTLFQLFDAFALASAAWLVARHAARWASPVARYVALPIGFAAFPLLTMVGVRLSEPLFLALTAGALFATDRHRPVLRHAVAAGGLAGLAMLTRSIGLAVVAGVVLAFLLRGHRRLAAGALVTALLVVSPWIAWVVIVGDLLDPRLTANYGNYVADVREAGILALITGVDLRAFGPIARLGLPALPSWMWYPAAMALVGVVVWGAVGVARPARALVSVLAFYLALVTVWLFTPDRFIWVLLPWVCMLGVMGATDLWRRHMAFRPVVALLGLAVTFGFLKAEARSLTRRGFAAAAEGISAPFAVLAPSVKEETAPHAVIAGADEALMFLYSGRRSVPGVLFQWEGAGGRKYLSSGETAAFYCDMGVTHIASTGPGDEVHRIIDPLLSESGSVVVPLWQLTNGPALYQFRCPR